MILPTVNVFGHSSAKRGSSHAERQANSALTCPSIDSESFISRSCRDKHSYGHNDGLGQRDALIHRSLIAVAPAPFQSSAGDAMDTTSNGSNLTGSTSAQRRVLGDDQGPQVPRRSMRGSYQRVSIDNCFYSCHSLTFLEEQPCLRHAHHF